MAPIRRTFTIKEKVDIISRLENGESNVGVCKEFKVSHSTISTMWKNRSKILECFKSKSLKRKRNRKPNHENIENALLLWFKDQKSQNVPINGRQLQEKANHFARLFGKTDFECSESWIYRFRQRHDIVLNKVSGKTSRLSKNDRDNWLNIVLPKLTESYSESEIWNADETGLFFKLTPERTLQFKGEKCTEGCLSKDRITVLVASNMAGEKRKLLIIGNEKNPRCFQNVETLPIYYEANKNAWITSEIFEKVLRDWDSELKRNETKIILFIDNCPAHVQIDDLTNIKLVFFPPNTTSVIQPVNKGIIKTLKSNYRKNLVQKMIIAIEKNIPFSVNLLDATEMITTAWARVTTNTIKKCFVQAGFCKSSNITSTDEDSDNELDNFPLVQLGMMAPTETNVADWETFVNIDNEVITTSNLTDDEIIGSVVPSLTIQEETEVEECKEEEEHEEEGENCQIDDIPTIEDALCAVTILKRYCLFGEGKDNIDIEAVMKMERTLHRTLAQKSILKQCNMSMSIQ